MSEKSWVTDVLKLPDSHARSELLWCAVLAGWVDHSKASFETQALARAANVAIGIAFVELERQREEDRLRAALRYLRTGIQAHASDTVWVGPGETAVDYITDVLKDHT